MNLLPQSKSPIAKELDILFFKLKDHDPDTDEYKQTLDRIATLSKLDFETKRKPVSNDTLITVGANLLAVIMILRFEELNPLVTKAIQFLPRAR